MSICLTLVERNGRVFSAVFDKDEISIGRSSTNDLCPDPIIYNQVSRKHSRVVRLNPGKYIYEDLNSTQGSYFEGKEIREPMVIRRGDSVTLGKDGPTINFSWPQDRVTGQMGTHLRQRIRTSPIFPLVFSDKFLGIYKRYDRIAAGGFGEVWKGTPVDDSTPVAIKLMHPQLLDPNNLADADRESLITRFAREARITFQLSASGAPGIPRVYSWGDDADRDYLYIVMELINGVSFDKMIYPRQPLPVHRVASIMYQVAKALEAAHSFDFVDDSGIRAKGVVHRDVKPNNIIVEKDTDRAWMVDFGVAGFQEGGDRITSTNITVGTHQFLPLESIERQEVSPATDLWGFVVTMYLALTGGRFPYQGGERLDLIRALKTGDFVPITTYCPLIPTELERAIHASLAVEPEKRIPSAAKWVEVLAPLTGEITKPTT